MGGCDSLGWQSALLFFLIAGTCSLLLGTSFLPPILFHNSEDIFLNIGKILFSFKKFIAKGSFLTENPVLLQSGCYEWFLCLNVFIVSVTFSHWDITVHVPECSETRVIAFYVTLTFRILYRQRTLLQAHTYPYKTYKRQEYKSSYISGEIFSLLNWIVVKKPCC